ncbi:hypothetical protein GQX74_010691 [Glossina fuscipes]|nr:hypothetical protein GQX74_010691 [Glossina fuscipes]
MSQPQLLQIKLSRFDAQPWGFRLQGGVDFASPLLVQKGNRIAENVLPSYPLKSCLYAIMTGFKAKRQQDMTSDPICANHKVDGDSLLMLGNDLIVDLIGRMTTTYLNLYRLMNPVSLVTSVKIIP